MNRARLNASRVICLVASVLSVALIIDGLFGIKRSVADDNAGQTDAGLGAILLIPFEVGASIVAAISIFGALVFLLTTPVDEWLPKEQERALKRKRLIISAITTALVLYSFIAIVTVAVHSDNDVMWILPGVGLYTALSLMWLIVLAIRLQKLKKHA